MKNKNKILVSVITPCYNCEKYIKESVESIQNQTYKNIEHIIINDGSKDESLQIIKNLSSKYSNIKIINHKINKGISFSRNEGIAVAKGKYILWQDGDDIANKNRIKTQLEYLEQHKNIAIVGSYLEYFENITGIRKYPLSHEQIIKKIFKITPIAQPAIMIKKSVFNTIGLYDEGLKTGEDTDMLYRVLQSFKGANIPKALVKYRYHDNSITYRELKNTIKSTVKIRQKYTKVFKMSMYDKLYNKAESYINIVPEKLMVWVFNKVKNRI
ncbi:glycosyltransferase [Patescibacteria group bacterium]|nr:glycosyltransferase [Patescibacteria group bacterium]